MCNCEHVWRIDPDGETRAYSGDSLCPCECHWGKFTKFLNTEI